jgi:hypothetical protein
MRIRGFEIADRTVVLGLVAAYAAVALIGLSILISTAMWPAVSQAL